MFIAFLLFKTFLLAPAVFAFKVSVENLPVSLISSTGSLTLKKCCKMTTIPKSLEDAATVDGANRVQVISLVVLPLIWSGLVAIATFGFLQSWSAYLMALAFIPRMISKPSHSGFKGKENPRRA